MLIHVSNCLRRIRIFDYVCYCCRLANLRWSYECEHRHHQMRCCRAQSRQAVGNLKVYIFGLADDIRHRTRALVLLPLFANAGMLLGPLIGGMFAGTVLNKSLHSFPYALPNLIAAALYASAATGAMIWLEETRVGHQQSQPGLGQLIRSRIHGIVTNSRSHRYTALGNNEDAADSPTGVESAPALLQQETQPQTRHSPLRFWDIWTFNVICTMLAHFIITGHLGTFSSLWAIFLSTPTGKAEDQHLPFRFIGGLGLRPLDVGVSMSFLGAIGVVLQAMVYPSLNDRYGTIKIWRYALCIFPIVYLIAPFPSLAASSSHSDKTTVGTWISMGFVMLLFMIGRTGVTPATTLLINDCTPHPSVRATIHTTGTVIGNLSRSVFPVAALGIFGYGLRIGVVGLGFWCLTVLGVLACFASLWVKEGTPVDEPHEPRRSV